MTEQVVLQVGWVTQASPLRVKVEGASTDTAATVMDRGTAYAPAGGARVLVGTVGRKVYVIGGLG